MSLHKNVAPESRHPTPIRHYADASERLADETLTANEDGGFVWQHDDDSVWMLTSYELGTWLYISSASLVFNDVDHMVFSTEPSTPLVHTPGRVEWNNDLLGTFNVYTSIEGVILQIGHEMYMIVRNNSGNDIVNGIPVAYNGATGGLPNITASNLSNARFTIGISTHDIPKNTVGLITILGAIHQVDTSAFNDGDILYVGNSGFQTTQPPAPYGSVVCGVVVYAHPVSGIIGVRIRIIQDFAYLCDVAIRNKVKTDTSFVKYDTSIPAWDLHDMPWLVGDYDPTGFHRGIDNFGGDTDGDIAFVDGTRTFTISPKAGQSSFGFYVRGKWFSKTATENVVITDTEGPHLIYYDEDGVLQETTSIDASHFLLSASVAYIYWDSINDISLIMADERHGYHMDGRTHLYLHKTSGAAYMGGLTPQGLIVDGSGSLDTSIQLGYESGEIADEDVFVMIPSNASPSNIPVFYRFGSGIWRKKTADAFPIIYPGTAGYGGDLVPYNLNTGGNWTLESVPNNDFLVMLYFSSTDSSIPIFGVQGQATYATIGQARIGIKTELENLIIDGLPFIEFVPCYGMIVQVSSTYSNTPGAIFRSLDDGSSFLNLRKVKGVFI